MSIKIDGSQAQVHWLSNISDNGLLTKNHGILYANDKLGQVTTDTVEGLKPNEAFERRYAGQKSSLKEDLFADDIIVFDKDSGVDFDYDDGVRRLVHELYSKGKIPFDALHPDYQLPNQNSEALIGYNREKHLDILIDIVKQYYGLGQYFDTKDPVEWRWGQESEVEGIVERLRQHHLCLYAAYTGRGKTKISMEVAARNCQQGGIVLVTTPITETKDSFKQNIRDSHFGFDRNLQVTYMESTEFSRHSVADLVKRANSGELIIIVLTVQDARYADSTVDDVVELRDKYSALSGHVDLWVRDERHFQYGGEITSQRLANMHAKYELDLTATPYNVLDKYKLEHILSRTLIWGLKNREYTGLPFIRIDAINTPVANVSSAIANIFTEDEGYDPRKLVIRNNGQFVLEAEWRQLSNLMYHSPLSKRKNPLSIDNDVELSPAAKNCGMWVLPPGQDGDSASEYIPDLAAILNLSSQGQTYFTDSYTVERTCPKDKTIGEYVTNLMIKHGRVVILTCGKFLTGTDIPPLGHIVLFDKMNNIADFEQLVGRMTRNYPGKTEVKLYTLMPGSSVGVVLGRMAKASSMLGGGTEYEYLECIPLSQYDSTENDFVKLNPESILQDVQTWFQDQVRHRLPSYSLQVAISGIDTSVWDSIDTSEFKKNAPKTDINDNTGARVKDKISTDPTTGQPRTKSEINKLEQIEKAIQAITFESQWIAYSINNYDFEIVYRSPVLTQMFGQKLVDAVFDAIGQSPEIESMIRKHLLDKQQAYGSLFPEEVYDEIFVNSDLKKNNGLVYVPFALAEELVSNLNENKYNNKDVVILVENALNGTIPLTLKKKFPLATIVCGEHFTYFIDHLTRLGFKTLLWDELDMEFDAIIGNPPYQKPKENTRLGSRGDSSLWDKFVHDSLARLKPNGEMALIHPTAWRKPEDRYNFWQKLTKDNQLVKLVMSSGKREQDWFNIGVRVDYYVLEKTPKYKNTKVIDHEDVEYDLDLADYEWLPNFAINEITQILGTGTTVLYNTWYHTQKDHRDYPDSVYKYPVVHTINQNGLGIKYFENLPVNDETHFSVPKVLLNQNELQYPYNDYKGEYGMSQLTFGIKVDSKEDGDKLVDYLNSNAGKRLIAATKWNTYYTDYGMFKSFKKDWYK